MVKIKKKQEG